MFENSWENTQNRNKKNLELYTHTIYILSEKKNNLQEKKNII